MSKKIQFKKIPVGELQIPNEYDLRELPLELSDAQIESMSIIIWHQYILHDEITAALNFIQNAPYQIKHSKKICEAIEITKKMSEHMENIEEDKSVNTAKTPDGVPFDHEIISFDNFEIAMRTLRFTWVLEKLPPGAKVIDFGPYDGHFSNKWAAKAIDLTGIDLCEEALVIARDVAIKNNLNAKYINCYFSDVSKHLPLHSFDIATSTDAYEHLKDPLNDLLIPARSMLNGTGKMLFSTPDGSVTRGKYVECAYPWNVLDTLPSWLEGLPRAHIIAPTVWTVTDNFRKAGFWVYECKVYPLNELVQGQGNILVQAYASAPIIHPGKEFLFIDCDDFTLANNLASVGHSVKAFIKDHEECVLGFIEYRNIDKLYLESNNKTAIRVRQNGVEFCVEFHKNGTLVTKKIQTNNANIFLNSLGNIL